MKKLRMSLMLFLGVLVSGITMAMGEVKVDVVPGKKEKALVNILDAPNNQLQVELKDRSGDVIYTDSKDSPSYDYKRLYDFSELNNGKYSFEASLGDETELNNLVVKNGKVQIIGQKDQITPNFSLNGKYLEFSFPNSEQKSVRLLLFDNDTRHWVFQERLNPEFDIKQALNLSKLNSGNYKVMLVSGNDAYDYEFHIS